MDLSRILIVACEAVAVAAVHALAGVDWSSLGVPIAAVIFHGVDMMVSGGK